MPVLIQWAVDNGDIYLHEIWTNKVKDTLELIEFFCRHEGGICGFNLTFDWFQLVKIYNVFRLCDPEIYPDEHIEEIACLEKRARDGVCLKPVKALDLFLHARKCEYQSLLDRKDIRIRKVPTALARPLADELNKRIKFNALYFARRKEKLANPWQVFPIKEKGSDDIIDPDFKDIVLKFAPSSGLKALAVDAGLVAEEDVMKFDDVGVSPKFYPDERGYAPYAEAVGSPGNWGNAWPTVIKYHIEHFAVHKRAREYSRLDVVYTRGLYEFFGRPDAGDDDSELACSVAAIRWKGFKVDLAAIQKLKDKALKLEETAPKSPSRVKDWIFPDLTEDERQATGGRTGKVILEEMSTWKKDCVDCDEGVAPDISRCPTCGGSGEVVHPAATKARMVLQARFAKKEVEVLDKLLLADRLHASFKIIGALSGRFSGADGLNAMAIKRTKETRSCFPLAWDDQKLCGGDFESFEVVIAVAIYKDPKLEADLDTYGMCPGCKGTTFKLDKHGNPTDKLCEECGATGSTKKKIHALFGEVLYKLTYDEIIETKGTSGDKYTPAKSGVFSQLYGGNHTTLMTRLGIDEATAIEAAEGWGNRYGGIKKAQQRINNMFCTMRQVGGLGSKIEWNEPERCIKSLLGFPRYFDLENRICKVLFDLAEKPPKEWTNLKSKVKRRDREQTASGATRSALFGAAFQIQAANLRAAQNHEIQASGAGITKRVQRRIWDLQPVGVHPFKVAPMNVHDEIMCPCLPEMQDIVTDLVKTEVDKFKPIVPRISIDWSKNLKTWADK